MTSNGTVTFLQDISVGDTIPSGRELMQIVPNKNTLKLTVYIPADQISKIKIGQEISCYVDSIPYQEYGRVTGTLTSISATSFTNQSTGEKYYIGQADINEISLSNGYNDTRELRAGMSATVNITSGSKKIIVWLLEKIQLID